MTSYTHEQTLKRRVLRTLDSVSLDFTGRMTDKIYAVTITSRKKYNNLYQFREAFYKFLNSIGYDFAIKGYMEFHSQGKNMDKVHAHGYVFNGNPPKNNLKNQFHFHIRRIEDKDAWESYCKKDIMETLERHHDIRTGLYNYKRKPVILFTESE